MCDAIRSTWNNKVARDLQGHGTAIFVNFLTANPGEQKKFSKFASVPTASLSGNRYVQEQAMVIMKKLDSIVNSGDLHAATSDLAASHKAMNVTIPEFKKIFPIIIDHVVARAGADRGPWTSAFDAIGAAIASQQ
ncbi:hemoglobin F-I-like [Gigantopelta aegis]|uniref:hemoglobin F-I-like n=1 Tax=Gigantopelta aegis TaxID=1735272 RepID=UPI001B8897F1|nr:hemoglobin F-I-like [Gigantopelta aegis]